MKRVIRRSVWETNSSTSHSVAIMLKDKYEEWEKDDKYLFNPNWWDPFEKLPKKFRPIKGELYDKKQVEAFCKLKDYLFEPDEEELDGLDAEDREYELRRQFDDFAADCDFIRYLKWSEDEYLETDVTNYTTPGGEEIVICCKYGRDG